LPGLELDEARALVLRDERAARIFGFGGVARLEVLAGLLVVR